jgi:hypothetical protein
MMVFAAFKDYLPLSDLVKILVTCLAVAVVAPSAVAVSVVGLDRRSEAVEQHRSSAAGTALVAAGVIVLAALIVVGLVVLSDR